MDSNSNCWYHCFSLSKDNKGGKHMSRIAAEKKQLRSIYGKESHKKILKRAIILFILIVSVLFFIFPIFWLIGSAFKTQNDMFSMPPVFFPNPTIEYFKNFFLKEGNTRYFINSVIVATMCSFFSVTIGTLAAYIFVRWPFKGQGIFKSGVLLLRLLPPIVLVLPMYVFSKALGLYDTHLILALVVTIFNLPFVIWTVMSFMIGIPKEIEESAYLDGCSQMSALLKIILPQILPGVFVATVFSALYSWNEFIFALTLTNKAAKTAPILAMSYITQYDIEYGSMFATGVLIMAPAILFGVLIRKYFVRGLSFGAIK
jgi:multiple sugar transport system permease protein